MLNYGCKSHRGRSPANRSDSLCIIEFEGSILRAFATIIPNKQQSTIVPIICSQVNAGSIIHTDEHGAYCNLNNFGFIHAPCVISMSLLIVLLMCIHKPSNHFIVV
jgi:transposase-like protein